MVGRDEVESIYQINGAVIQSNLALERTKRFVSSIEAAIGFVENGSLDASAMGGVVLASHDVAKARLERLG